jgi:hypothetical protein
MEYLIDSDVLSIYLGGEHHALGVIENLLPAGVAISIVTYMETYQATLRDADPIASVNSR